MKAERKIRLKIGQRVAKKIRGGYPLLTTDMIKIPGDEWEQGSLLDLYDEQGFVARAYYGRQNKGLGWVLTKDEGEAIDADFFIRTIGQAAQKRQGFFSLPETDCFRLFNGEGDGIGGLEVDYYAGYLVVYYLSRGIYAFRASIRRALEVAVRPLGIYEKRRFGPRGAYIKGDDFVQGQPHPQDFTVKEHGICYASNLNAGAMTGLFLDQRQVRGALIEDYSKGAQVLNTFAYTGAFSLAAKRGGAKKTVSVDLAKRSLGLIRKNFTLNGYDPKEEVIFIDDVYRFLSYAQKKALSYDVIILDPPAFSRSKKGVFSARKDYASLVFKMVSILKEGGLLLASTNLSDRSFPAFKKDVSGALAKAGRDFELVSTYTNPEDFPGLKAYPESFYLKVLFYRVGKKAAGKASS